MEDPIIIHSMPRSGSSLISKIFYWHGIQIGQCEGGDVNNPDGYFQNKKIERFHKEVYKPRVHKGVPAEPYDFFYKDLMSYIGNEFDFNFKWLVKFSSMYTPPWKKVFPDAITISCRRNVKSVIESGKKSGLFKTNENHPTISKHIEIMNEYSDISINFDNLFYEDFSEIKFALNYLGVNPDEEKIKNAINKNLRRF